MHTGHQPADEAASAAAPPATAAAAAAASAAAAAAADAARLQALEAELAKERALNAELSAQLATLRSAGQASSSGSSWQGLAQAAPAAAGPGAALLERRLVAFSGGTGFNALCADLRTYTTHVAHVLPVSDDGGSTAEIVRVLGGPAVGDIRSRCLRLADDAGDEARAVRRLLGHRLPSASAAAKAEWASIVEGESELWEGVSEPYKHTVRSFLAHFHFQIVRQAGTGAGKPFDYGGGSIGNFFFAGARIFFRSLDAAIFLFSRVSGIPAHSVVLPVVSTMGRLRLGAELADGSTLRGQSTISHPARPGTPTSPAAAAAVDKSRGGAGDEPLPAPITRVMYLSTEETDELHEVFPPVNPAVLQRIADADAVVYGIGSLWSSICASLIAGGVGDAVARRDCAKVLMLNGTRDRETTDMNAVDVVQAITSSLNRSLRDRAGSTPAEYAASAYVTTVLAPRGGELYAEEQRTALLALGVRDVRLVDSERDAHGRVLFQPGALVDALREVVEQHRRAAAERTGYDI